MNCAKIKTISKTQKGGETLLPTKVSVTTKKNLPAFKPVEEKRYVIKNNNRNNLVYAGGLKGQGLTAPLKGADESVINGKRVVTTGKKATSSFKKRFEAKRKIKPTVVEPKGKPYLPDLEGHPKKTLSSSECTRLLDIDPTVRRSSSECTRLLDIDRMIHRAVESQATSIATQVAEIIYPHYEGLVQKVNTMSKDLDDVTKMFIEGPTLESFPPLDVVAANDQLTALRGLVADLRLDAMEVNEFTRDLKMDLELAYSEQQVKLVALLSGLDEVQRRSALVQLKFPTHFNMTSDTSAEEETDLSDEEEEAICEAEKSNKSEIFSDVMHPSTPPKKVGNQIFKSGGDTTKDEEMCACNDKDTEDDDDLPDLVQQEADGTWTVVNEDPIVGDDKTKNNKRAVTGKAEIYQNKKSKTIKATIVPSMVKSNLFVDLSHSSGEEEDANNDTKPICELEKVD
jgi:hypothetical protein